MHYFPLFVFLLHFFLASFLPAFLFCIGIFFFSLSCSSFPV